jgi:hypothetical protein
LCCQRLVQSLLTFGEAKASIHAMVYDINLREILCRGGSARGSLKA